MGKKDLKRLFEMLEQIQASQEDIKNELKVLSDDVFMIGLKVNILHDRIWEK